MKTPSQETISKQSIIDLREDCDTLARLCRSQQVRLIRFQKEITNVKQSLDPLLVQTILTKTQSGIADCTSYHTTILALEKALEAASERDVSPLTARANQYRLLLRTNQSLIAGLVTSTDWQSPSFLQSGYSQAGRQTGTIVGTISDYKRDHHHDAAVFEKQFRKEYIDGLGKALASVSVTQSGMAALATIINFLLIKADPSRPMLIGQNSYFENKFLLEPIFGKRLVTFDETDIDALVDSIIQKQPVALFLDSLANVSKIVIPDLPAIMSALKKYSRKQTYLVIDNTGLATSFQPLHQIAGKTTKVRLLMFESLNKYYQFGMDRTTGGVIWGFGQSVAKIFSIRMHSGTVLTDSSSLLLPIPNRQLLNKRLVRFERNTLLLAKLLADFLANDPNSPLAEVVYPGLPSHSCFAWTRDVPFHGSFFVLRFKKRYAKVSVYQKLLKTIITEASKRDVDIVAGTSFGFDTTRVYLTALRTDITEPFFRVSVGTEPLWQIYRLFAVFVAALKRIR